jgi:uncharacterized protein GlcG (DUF336 family)
MKTAAVAALALLAALPAASPALAQMAMPNPPAPAAPRPAPTPPAPGPDVASAWSAAQAAVKACLPDHVGVSVLDSAGVERLVLVSDGGPARSAEMSRRKAATALTFGKPSMEVRDAARTDTALADRLKNDPKLLGFGGGLPVMRDGKPFGAIGVAGGSSQDLDQKCAAAGLALLQH